MYTYIFLRGRGGIISSSWSMLENNTLTVKLILLCMVRVHESHASKQPNNIQFSVLDCLNANTRQVRFKKSCTS